MREAVGAYLDDLEDAYLADRAMERIEEGEETVHEPAEVERELGLADRADRLRHQGAAQAGFPHSTAHRSVPARTNRSVQGPRRLGKPLKRESRTYWRYRVGAYRLVYHTEDRAIRILVVRVAQRKGAYRDC